MNKHKHVHRSTARALTILIEESMQAQRRRAAALFAVYATAPEATPHGREVSREKARRSAMYAGPRRSQRALYELGDRAIKNLDARIRAACAEAAVDADLPEWVRKRAMEFDGFGVEAPTRRNR